MYAQFAKIYHKLNLKRFTCQNCQELQIYYLGVGFIFVVFDGNVELV